MWKKQLPATLLLCVLIVLMNALVISAQEPEEPDSEVTPTPQPEEDVAFSEDDPNGLIDPIFVSPSGRLNITFEQMGYDTFTLSNGSDQRSYRFDLPGNFQILPTGNYLDLVTAHIPAIPDKFSVIEVTLDDIVIGTIPLTATNAPLGPTRIDITENLLQVGRNTLELDLNIDDSCEDPGGAITVSVDKESTLSFNYQQQPYPIDLALYPFPFNEQSLLSIPTVIVLPDNPSSELLSAAATIAAGLGQVSNGDIDLSAALVSSLNDLALANSHLIIVGKPEEHPLLEGLDLQLTDPETIVEPGQGTIDEFVSPWNDFRVVLAVSGYDDTSIFRAAQALNRQAHFLGMNGPTAIVLEVLDVSQDAEAEETTFTLEELGYEDEIAYGILPQTFVYNFYLPQGWQLEEPPFFVLKFAHADVLVESESVIEVSLNRIPLNSVLLDKTNTEGELIVPLPGHRLKSGRNQLRVVVEMRLPDSDESKCGNLRNQRAWTVLSNQSEFFLPYDEIDLRPDLRLFPYPFSEASGIRNTAIIIPDDLTNDVIDHLIQLATKLGSAALTEKVALRVAYASEADAILLNNNHIIVLGRPTNNALFAVINDHIPHPFVEGEDILEPLVIDTVVFSPSPDRDAGLLELATSPWNPELTLLAVTGTTNEGVGMAVEALIEQQGLKGDLAVIEPLHNPFVEETVQLYTLETRLEEISEENPQLPTLGTQSLPAPSNTNLEEALNVQSFLLGPPDPNSPESTFNPGTIPTESKMSLSLRWWN